MPCKKQTICVIRLGRSFFHNNHLRDVQDFFSRRFRKFEQIAQIRVFDLRNPLVVFVFNEHLRDLREIFSHDKRFIIPGANIVIENRRSIFISMPSSVIRYMSYDASKKMLTIRFVSGAVYNYKNVSEEEYAQLKKSSSKGKYLNQHIKGKYDFEQVS